MKLTIEVRPGEGGADAKDLVATQGAIYRQFLTRNSLPFQTIQQPG